MTAWAHALSTFDDISEQPMRMSHCHLFLSDLRASARAIRIAARKSTKWPNFSLASPSQFAIVFMRLLTTRCARDAPIRSLTTKTKNSPSPRRWLDTATRFREHSAKTNVAMHHAIAKSHRLLQLAFPAELISANCETHSQLRTCTTFDASRQLPTTRKTA